MKTFPICSDIYYVGVNDRIKTLFENQLPLVCGVSYNSYLIVDEKVALIDTADSSCFEVYLKKIRAVLGDRKIDYLIVNHMEPDHSGSISLIRQYYPEITIVGNAKTFGMIEGFYGVTGNEMEIKEGSELSLGKHRLTFALIPMVHWPETMVTYDATACVAFSGDAFGCFGALNGAVVDSNMEVEPYWDEMRRYYACIVGKYGAPVQKALQKVSGLKIDYICPTHGPVWKEHIAQVVEMYRQMSLYESEPGLVIAYGSMYGNTEQMAEAVAAGAAAGGVRNIRIYNTSYTDTSFILRDIFKYRGLVVGSPTYMNEIFPTVEALLLKVERRGVKNRVFGSFGSFTWAGAAVRRMNALVETLGWDKVASVEEKQGLKDEKYEACYQMGLELAEKLK